MANRYRLRIFAAGLSLAMSATAFGQEPPTTLWSFLGIPQAVDRVNAGLLNRGGSHPCLEQKPAVSRLADPANLKSDVPAIKKAAEIKKSEDLKPQKIKAVKYLASIGCGCYDADGSVTEALVAAMGDCTEEVRLETVNAVGRAASGQCCANCGSTCCCNQKISDTLFQISQGVDDAGCPKEPSMRVRQAAMRALSACCPNRGPASVAPDEEPSPAERRETGEGSGAPAPPEPTPAAPEPAAPSAEMTGEETTPVAAIRVKSSDRGEPDASDALAGVIMQIDTGKRLAHVHFENRDLKPEAGETLWIYEDLPTGTRYRGELEVVQGFAGAATVRPIGGTSLAGIRPGVRVSTVTAQID
jgi:hypothetical protein